MMAVMAVMVLTMVKITMRPGEASGEQQKGAMPPFPSSSRGHFNNNLNNQCSVEGAHNASPLIAQDAAPVTAAPAAPGAPDPTRVTARHRSLISRAAACCTRSANGIRKSLCATLVCSILILLGILLLRELGWFIIHNSEGKIDRNEDDIDL